MNQISSSSAAEWAWALQCFQALFGKYLVFSISVILLWKAHLLTCKVCLWSGLSSVRSHSHPVITKQLRICLWPDWDCSLWETFKSFVLQFGPSPRGGNKPKSSLTGKAGLKMSPYVFFFFNLTSCLPPLSPVWNQNLSVMTFSERWEVSH